MKKLLLVFILFLGFQNLGLAATKKHLATFHQSGNKELSKLYLVSNKKGDIIRFYFKNYSSSGKLDKTVKISLRELKKGKVVYRQKGTDVITLTSENISRHNGGHITIKFLKEWNAFSDNVFKKFEVELDRLGDQWILKREGRRFNTMVADVYTWGIHRFNIIK
ncbi:MAG: hypothetical protein HN509_07495 [Halobacteriovoraceae bacterium]|jgi:hypothetical protein|nr:hypothetical protein [Halobacteriovoraceae bacterium]MBT5092634.1 hypothetical protein [Halobacteriovoraceae bacterium]